MFAFKDFSKHHPISHKTIQGKIKSSWLILFNKEMTEPSPTITGDKCVSKILDFSSKNKINKKNKGERCAYEMHKLIVFIFMLPNIIRIELFKTIKFLFHGI